MNATATLTSDITAGKELRVGATPDVPVSVTGPNGRHGVTVRISAKGRDIRGGFENSFLEEGYVTVEVHQTLPHRPTADGIRRAHAACQQVALDGLNTTLEALLARLSLPPADSDLLEKLVSTPTDAVAAGFAEPVVRALVASPLHVWNALTPEEKAALRGIYPLEGADE